MTDDEKRDWVRARLESWRSPLFLDRWRMHVNIEEKDSADNEKCAAEISTASEYAEVVITVYPRFWQEATNDTEREYMLLHELCHPITARMKQLTFDILNDKFVTVASLKHANETATEWIAAIIWRASGRPVVNN